MFSTFLDKVKFQFPKWAQHFQREDWSIDLGTANTIISRRVNSRDATVVEIILDQPSVVAIVTNSYGSMSKPLVRAVGNEAKEMLGRTPTSIKAIRPLKDGVIADFTITEKMLQHFFSSVYNNRYFRLSPRVCVCVPCGATQVERRAIRESVLSAGAKQCFLMEEPMAAALGAGLPVDSPSGSMVVDIGGGTAEIAIISLNGIVFSQSVRVGGDRFDESIVSYVRRHFGCVIGEATAERIKKTIGIAYPSETDAEMTVSGRNVSEGVPRSFTIRSSEVMEAMQEPLTAIASAVKNALEEAPPELASDLSERGIVLTGGGALLKNIHCLIREATGLPVFIAEDPLTCVARGGGKVLQHLDKFLYCDEL